MDVTPGSDLSSSLMSPVEDAFSAPRSRTWIEDRPEISVIISTHNRAAELEATLPALFKQDLDSARYEVIVVDNNSSDATPDAISRLKQAHPALRAFHEPKPGVSNGRNCGIVH